MRKSRKQKTQSRRDKERFDLNTLSDSEKKKLWRIWNDYAYDEQLIVHRASGRWIFAPVQMRLKVKNEQA